MPVRTTQDLVPHAISRQHRDCWSSRKDSIMSKLRVVLSGLDAWLVTISSSLGQSDQDQELQKSGGNLRVVPSEGFQ
jgi:hypothetical protein